MKRPRSGGNPAAPAGRLSQLFRALRHPNYRLFFSGQSVSLIGSWMTRVATSWLLWRLTQSPAMLGVLGFVGQIPTFLLAPVAGVWVDRLDRHRLLVATQILAMLQSLALAALALTGTIAVWHILALQCLQGVINSFDMPARQSLLVDLLEDRRDLSNAIAMNSTMVNGARLVGPSLAGLLIAWAGEGWCFLVDGLSYGAVILSLLLMRLQLAPRPHATQRILQEFRDGLTYVRGFSPILWLLLLLALVGLVGMPYTVLLPIIASATLHGGAHTLGFLMGAMGVGALAGALYLASRPSVAGLGRLVPLASAIFGIGLVGVGLSGWYPLSLALMALTGVGFMVHLASTNTLIQTLVDERMRGRVMALYTVAFTGMTPFGSLLAGAIAGRIGAPLTLVCGGALCVLGAAGFARLLPQLRAQARPVLVTKGILPEIAQGLGESAKIGEEMGE